jgi:putative peptidoglycan lipid II flippase
MTGTAPPLSRVGVGRGLAGAAVAIGAVTVLARLLGFGRVVVFSHTVGTTTCLGSAYFTANTVPNLLFEVAAGGALAGLVVPVLAGPADRGDAATAGRTASALLGWTLVVLTPVAVLAAVLAGPLVRLFVDVGSSSCAGTAVAAVAARMLVVFAPQVVLYGIGIVLSGVLQAHRRFLGPALAPLLSSAVVIAAYLVYDAQTTGRSTDLEALSSARELTLSVGTTLGVVALSLSLLIPLRRTGLRLRPTLRFPPGVAPRVRRLALAGAAGLAAQQVSVAVVLRLANTAEPRGGIVLYNLAWALFLLPWAVLAVPIATSAFPTLSARAADGEGARYAWTAAVTTRAVVLVTAAAAAVLAAAAVPAARMLVLGTPGDPDPAELARGLVAFAPGLVGYGLVAHLGRALYAGGQGRAAGAATVAGWLTVAVADVLLVAALPADWTVAALGAGNTVGMTLAGALMLGALRRGTAGAGVAGVPRALAAAAPAAVAALVAGRLVAGQLPPAGPLGSALTGAVVAAAAVVVFGVVVLLGDGEDLRSLRALRRG